MKYSDWKELSANERKNMGWHRHPHIKTATLYGIAFFVTLVIVILGISKNSSVHINRKPTSKEAFETAKIFIRERLTQPATATFPLNSFTPTIDTATNTYQIQSTAKSIDADGKAIKATWDIKMIYKGGDWSDRNSWQVENINIK
jgi:ABC-type transport system involved in multi-copper enzyme maturation permease subunit